MRAILRTGIRCLALLLLGVAWLRGMARWPGSTPVSVRLYGEREGLPNLTIHDVTQGPDGRLWVGTQDGAACFDGRTWKSWDLPLQGGSDWVRAVLPSQDGSVWFGTQDAGLWQWRAGTWIHHDASKGLPFTRINTLLETRSPSGALTLWAGSGGEGLGRWRDGHWDILGTKDGLPSGWIWRLRQAPDPEGGRSVWICTQAGLVRWKDGRLLTSPALDGFKGWETEDILTESGPDGFRATVACWEHGLAEWDGRAWHVKGPSEGFPSLRPICLGRTRAPGQAPITWAGTYNDGLLWRQGPGAWRPLAMRSGTASRGIYAMFPMRGHPNLWVGFLGGGLAALDTQGWETVPDPPGMASPLVYSVAETKGRDGGLWLGTTSGVARWSSGRWRTFTARQGLAGDWVESLCPTRAFGAPGLLAGGVGGLSLWQENRWRRLPTPGVEIGEAQAVLEVPRPGKSPELWIGTNTDGLIRESGGRWRRYGKEGEFPGEDVYALHATGEAGGGSLWVGSRGLGLGRLHQGRWTLYGVKDGLPSASVYAMADSTVPSGVRLWVATPGGGLGWLDVDRPGAVWHRLDRLTVPPLPADALMALAKDGRGRIYVTSTQGVVRITVPSGHEDQPSDWRIETFTHGDGLPSNDCISGAVLADGEGRIWVGTVRGLAVYDPRREIPPDPLPHLLLEGVEVDGHPRIPGPAIGLGYRQRHLHLDYALPVFHRAEDVRYRTQIVGLEEQPSAWTSEGRWDLAALPSGHYTLWIQGKDALGRLSVPLLLPVSIQAAPWRRPLAYALYALVLGASVFLVYRLRTRWLREQNLRLEGRVRQGVAEIEQQSAELRRYNERLLVLNDEKTRMLALVAHDLRNPLTAIHLRAEQILHTSADPMEGWARSILVGTLQMETLIDRILEVAALDGGRVRMESAPIDVQAIAQRTVDDFQAKAASKGFCIEIEAADSLPALRGDPFYFKEALDNLVSNAVKFTPPGDPGRKVVLKLTPGQVEVEDHGPGFQEGDLSRVFDAFVRLSARPTGGEPSTGLGLSLVKTLLDRMGGSVELSSLPGQGARFCLRLPRVEEG